MDGKLRILMQSENLTASKLAEILEVKPAAVSHILSRRNKPSFELLCKIVNRFPQINPYWLLGDDPQMLNANAQSTPAVSSVSEVGSLFESQDAKNVASANSNISNSVDILPSRSLSRTDISKIIIVYSDQTFEELQPKR